MRRCCGQKFPRAWQNPRALEPTDRPPWLEDEGVFPGLAGPFAPLFGRASLAFLDVLLCDISGTLSVATASGDVTAEAPQWRHGQRSGIRRGPGGPYQHGDTDASPRAEVQSFLQ